MVKNLIVCVLFCLIAAIPMSGFAVDLRDYTNPDTSYQEAYLSGRFNLQDKGDNRLSPEDCDEEDEECTGEARPVIMGRH